MSIPFVRAKYYDADGNRYINTIVLHTMEVPEEPTMAERIAGYFANPERVASCHYNCDNDSTVQSVEDKDIAWHAAGGNLYSLGIEQSGVAAQNATDWQDAYSQQMLKTQVAPLLADKAKQYNIPLVYVDWRGLQNGVRGITTHNDVRLAFQKTTHTDPGAYYPMGQVLELARTSGGAVIQGKNVLKALQDILNDISRHPIKRGEKGFRVIFLQKLLNANKHLVNIDGDYGPKTSHFVKQFKRTHHIQDTNGDIVGHATLMRLLNR